MNDFPIRVNMDVGTLGGRVNMDVGTQITPRVATSYEELENKPSINGVELVGDKSSADLGIDRTYVYEQNSAAATWTITHNLNKFPSVSVVDSAGTVCVGEVTYLDENSLICTFTAPFSGKAYLN